MDDTDTRPLNVFERIIGRSQSAAGRLRVYSALNPMLWLCGIVTPACFVGAWALGDKEPLSTILAITGCLPVGFTCLHATYFTLFKPEKLQSEDYQIRHEALELIKQKDSSFEISPSAVEVIASPAQRALPNEDRK